MGDVTYVVQVRQSIAGEEETLWRDLAEVAVPPRTKRETVLRRAIAQLSGAPSGTYRVLSPEDARALYVTTVVRDPELVIEAVEPVASDG